MPKMTIERLSRFRTIKRLIEEFNFEDEIETLKGVDPSKISVQNGRIFSSTEESAIMLIELQEKQRSNYKKLLKEYVEIQSYLDGIEDLTVREIAMRKFIKGQTYEEIGASMYMNRTTAARKLKLYVAHNAH